MKKAALFFSLIFLFIFFCNCKSKKIYSADELERIRITDSIARAQKQVLIQDFQEDIDFRENYE